MKFLKRMLSVLLTLPLLVSFGCGCNDDGIDENEDVTSISYFRNDIEAFNVARKNNTEMYQAIKNAVGVDIEVNTASGSGWSEVLSSLWFSGELPDMFLCEGPDEPKTYKKYIENGDIIAIDDYVNEETKDTYPNLYKTMKETEYLAYNLSYAEGKQWAVPCGWELEKSLYVRQDWIDNLNAKLAKCLVGEGVIANENEYNAATMYEQYKYVIPETLLEFYRLARAFTLYDPDGDNTNNTYGYESEQNTDMDAWIYVAFGCVWHTEMKDPKTGKYISSDNSDAAMYATAFINRLLAEGYMSPKSITNDNASKQNDFATGKTGMMFAHNWLNNIVGYMCDSYGISIEEATARITLCDPPMGETGAYGSDGGYDDTWRYTCINAKMSQKRIKTCLKFLDWMYSEEALTLFQYGVEGVHYKKETVNGKEVKTNLIGTDEAGFLKSVGAVDGGYQLYSLSWWTGHYYVENVTNGEIVAERMAKSAQYAYKVDYPYIQTDFYVDKITGLHDYFDETMVKIINDQGEIYWKSCLDDIEPYNFKTFGWSDIKMMPDTIQATWRTFKKAYNEQYGGNEVYEEYNNYIDSGKAMKRIA